MNRKVDVFLQDVPDQELKRLYKALAENLDHYSSIPLIEITPGNCAYLDDFVLVFNTHGVQQIDFFLEDLEQFSANQLFHLIGFFDKISKSGEVPPAFKDRYAKILWNLANHRAGGLSAEMAFPRKQTNLEKALNVARNYARKHSKLPIGGRYRNPLLEKPGEWGHVLVTGWYGTETTGDKAILGELLHRLWAANPELRVTVTSIDQKVSCKTNQEFGWENKLAVVELEKATRNADKYDAVIFGGGPIMETTKLELVSDIFIKANAARRVRILFGCGVGPIWSDRIRQAAAQIFRVASAGFFRDVESQELARSLGAGEQLGTACDPSVAFVDRWRKDNAGRARGDDCVMLSTLLRQQTKEFCRDANRLDGLNQTFSRQIAETLQNVLAAQPNVDIQMLAMHMYWRGMDDRLFNRKVAGQIAEHLPLTLVREYLDIFSVLERLSRSDAAVAMRYHSHLFSIALGIPFLSVDYTGENGKVANLLKMIGYQAYSETYAAYDPASASGKLMDVFSNREQIRKFLLVQTDVLVKKLETTFAELFGFPA